MTFTTERTDLPGSLRTAAGELASDYYVVAFPVDRAQWPSNSRHILATRPATDRVFRFSGLPAGRYYLAASTDLEPGEWFNPAFLAEMAGAGVPVTLGPGEKKVQDLGIAR